MFAEIFWRLTVLRNCLKILVCTAAIAMAAMPASAAPFGAATAGFTINSGEPSYSFGATTGSIMFSGPLNMAGTTGTLAGVTAGADNGTVMFSLTSGASVAQSVPSLFTFDDPTNPTGPKFLFSETSAQTTSISRDAQNGDTVQLYLLGATSGGTNALTPTAASVVVNLFGIGGQAAAVSFTLANPPAQVSVPEAPSSLIVVSALGLLALARWRRLRSV